MDAVNVSVSGYSWVDSARSAIEPAGNSAQSPVEWGAVLTLVTYMVASRFNSGVQVVELGENQMAIAHDNNLTHMLPGFPSVTGCDFGWLYVVSGYEATDYPGALRVIYDSLFAQCATYRSICSPKVVSELETELADADNREIVNLRRALHYYARDEMWLGNHTLTSRVFSGGPGRMASDALRGDDILPLEDAIAQVSNPHLLPPGLLPK